MNQKEIPVFFSVDDNYMPFLAVALNSAIQNASNDKEYKAIVLYKDVTSENRSRIEKLATDNFKIQFVPMESGLESITDSMANRLRCDYFTLTIYFRLFIADMFPEYDKAVYIDSDVVVAGDLADLYNIDINDNYIAACPDHSVVDIPELALYMEKAIGTSKHQYINSGVLLLNLKRLREEQFSRHFLELLNRYHFDCIAPDQDYLNAICLDNIHFLDECWDAMPNDNKQALANPRLIHYNLFSKPWCYDNVQYEEYFWKYAKDCGYMQEITDYKNTYSEEKKLADSKCLELLINRAEKIANSQMTFKIMYESGVKVRL